MILGIFIWIKILSEYLSLFDKNSNILQPAYSQISEILLESGFTSRNPISQLCQGRA